MSWIYDTCLNILSNIAYLKFQWILNDVLVSL